MFSTNIYSELRQLINDLKLNPEKYNININEDKDGTAITLDNENNHCKIHLKEENHSSSSVLNKKISSISQTKPNQEEIYNIKTKENNNWDLKNNNKIKNDLKQTIQKIKTNPKKKSSEINKDSKLTTQNKTSFLKKLAEDKVFQYFTKLDCDNYFKPKIFDSSSPLTKEKLDTFINNLIGNDQKGLTKISHPSFDIFVKDCQQEKEPINTKAPESTNSSFKPSLSSLESVRNELYSSITNYLYFLTGNKDIAKLVFPKQIFDQKFKNLEKTIRNIMT